MMASHRPADAPPEPKPLETSPLQPSAANVTLPQSNFLIGFDWVLSFGVLALAFLISSFAVRNSDFWFRLATGRLIADGQYAFGKDPFSYVGGDRYWTNHSWLFDWLQFRLFTAAGGAGVVIAKAIFVAIAAGVLLIARRAGTSVFPGVVCAGLALAAVAPRLDFQPTLASLLGLATLMALLIRMPKPAGSWRFPIAVGVLFCLWANLDQWFFLGPVFLLLYTIGQALRPEEGEDLATLWKAVGVGILACMLNPHHYHVWTFPPQLVDRGMAKIFAEDAEFGRVFKRAAFTTLDFTGEQSNPVNTYSPFILVGLGVIGFAVNYKRAAPGLAFIWLAAVALAAYYYGAVPFLAFVAAPIAAVNLAAAGQQLAERPMRAQAVRAMHAGRSGARAAVCIVGVLMIAASYAGWLHPWESRRRWQWEVEPDVSMKRAVEQIHDWRQAGLLPADARLLNLQPDFANYVAWYAPGEKTFFDFRLRFHRAEAEDYAALRRYLNRGSQREQRADSFDLQDFLRRYHIAYAVTSSSNRILNQRILNQHALEALLGDLHDPAHGPEWALWQVAGRTVTMGWTRQRTIPAAVFERLRFDPLREAYANPNLLPTPNAADLRPPFLAQSLWDRFVAPTPAAPAEADESMVLMYYRQILDAQSQLRHQTLFVNVQSVAARWQTPALNRWLELFRGSPATPSPEENAVVLLAVRAARRAIAASPDHPEGYYQLSKAYAQFLNYTFAIDIRDFVTVATMARCRARLPDDPSQNRPMVLLRDLLDQLANADFRAKPGRFDLGTDAYKLSTEYLRFLTDISEANLTNLDGNGRALEEENISNLRRQLADRDKNIKLMDAELHKNLDQYANKAATLTSALDRAAVARRFGLVNEAISELHKSHESLEQKPGGNEGRLELPPPELAMQLAIHAELVELMMYAGHAEEALQILNSIESPATVEAMNTIPVRNEYFSVRRRAEMLLAGDPRQMATSRFDGDPAGHYRDLRRKISLVVGDFDRAADVQKQDIENLQRDFDAFRARAFPHGPPPATDMPTQRALASEQFLFPILMGMAPAQAQYAGFAREYYISMVLQFQDYTQRQTIFHIRLALTYLEQGNIDSTVFHFRQALAGADAASLSPVQHFARDYLKVLERAASIQGANP